MEEQVLDENKNKMEEFKSLAIPLMDFLKREYNPHSKIVIDFFSANLLSQELGIEFMENDDDYDDDF